MHQTCISPYYEISISFSTFAGNKRLSSVNFFNQPKPKGFHHIPIYFDPQKEALQERIKKKEKEFLLGEKCNEDTTSHLSPGFIVNTSTFVKRNIEKRGRSQEKETLNVKKIVLLVVLLIVFYYFYF
ncbi:MAG TPA: hypothetical protein DDY68_00360 [Porphyromonadaceae bacterium]|nr:hypothetical protein [Porphyromonadaceae bacterium]